MKYLDYQKCAACAVWFGSKLMLTQRKTKVFQGMYGVVGGKIDHSDKSIMEGLKREIMEETGYYILNEPRILDSYISEEHKHKVFLFDISEQPMYFDCIRNIEPEKHSDWTLYTREEALKLNLVPFLRYYLENYLTPPELPDRFGV